MESTPNHSSEATISLKKAALIIILVAGIVLAIGLFVGYGFFWNQFDKRTDADLRLEAAQSYLEKKPKDAAAHAGLGLELLRRQEYKEAIEKLEKAYALDKKSIGIKFALGLAYSEDKQYKKARPILEEVVKQNPLHFLGQVNLGVLYKNTEEHQKALEAFNHALIVNPAAADLYLLRAETYEAMGKNDLALQDVNRALQFVPDYKEALKVKKRLGGK